MTIQNSAIVSLVASATARAFQSKHKSSPRAFLRNRKLTFKTVVGTILRMVKKSLQVTCNWLGELVNDEPPSKQAFSQARKKISPECFQELHEDGLRVNYSLIGENGLWNGFRLIGVDGSTLRLPESPELVKFFGRWPSADGQKPSGPMARISEFTDMTAKLVLSGRIAPCRISEGELAKEQLAEVVEKMHKYGQHRLIFVYDRGYLSDEFIHLHHKLGVDFIFRARRNFNSAIKEVDKGCGSENIIFEIGSPCLRVVQIDLSSGEKELLVTSLIDKNLYSLQALSEVYQGRWSSMEEGYKRQKITMQMENFSGKTVLAVLQEYWATLTVGNLIEMGCVEAEGYWIPGKLPARRVNRAVLFGSMRDSTMEVILGRISPAEYEKKFLSYIKRALMKARPGRSYSREGVKKPKCHHVYRRAC